MILKKCAFFSRSYAFFYFFLPLICHSLYTTKAFEGGNAARSLLDTSMQDLAKADREQVIERLAQGQSLDEAAAEFETDAYFDTWFAALSQQMQEIVQE